MSTQLYKEHPYHYFLDNRFFFLFENVILEPLCVDGGGLALSDLAQILCET